jgi:NAD(P)-dependent dehydrogenase (short-subunit alcohol dehydrogenase family)
MDYGLAGRTVVVTGAARGQGAAEAEILVREGARVIGADILDDEGKALAERLTALGPGGRRSRRTWTGPAAPSTAWSTTRACPTGRGCSTWTWRAGSG